LGFCLKTYKKAEVKKMSSEIKEKTHVVLKLKDIAYLSPSLQADLRHICRKVIELRDIMQKEPNPEYFVVNKDEPYAEKILEAILEGERNKQNE
jgi:D-alanyl-D-alanine dipeptidase